MCDSCGCECYDVLVKVSDLQYQTGASYPRPLLFCYICGGEYSADRGDYFMIPANHVLTCCGEPLALVVKKTVYEPL